MAGISKVQICNMALSNIGAGTIESIDEQSPSAKECKIWYDQALLETLEAYDWSFARKRVTLAPSTEDPPIDGRWAYRFLYPSDCLVARYIANPGGYTADAIPFTVEMNDEGEVKNILTNLEQPVMVYTFSQTTTTLFTRYFVKAFSYLLAHYVAYPLTKKRDVRSEMFDMYRLMISNAAASNANEGVDETPRDADTIRARA